MSELSYNADRLSREAVLKELARHTVEMVKGWTGMEPRCSVCFNDCGQLSWPCPTVENLSEAAEAIEEAIEEAERIANGPYYCGAETRAARMYEDPEPAEHCETEVKHEGDRCSAHDDSEQDRDDYDYDRLKDSRYD